MAKVGLSNSCASENNLPREKERKVYYSSIPWKKGTKWRKYIYKKKLKENETILSYF